MGRALKEPRFRIGDRVDFNNSIDPAAPDLNGTPGTVRRVVIRREYFVTWDDGQENDEIVPAYMLAPLDES